MREGLVVLDPVMDSEAQRKMVIVSTRKLLSEPYCRGP